MPRVRVAQASAFAEGEVRQLTIGATRVLLARVDGHFHAVGAVCPHQGAPLEEGLLHRRHLICPWHHSIFDLASGDSLEPPTLDCLRRFKVYVDGDDVLVDAPAHGDSSRPPELAVLDEEEDARTFAIVGAGAAGVAAAQELRRVGFQGKIVLIGQEHRLPYDRTHCSKGFLTGEVGPDAMPLRREEFYPAHGIWRTTRPVRSVDVGSRLITFEDGGTLVADRILIATGAEPRRLQVPGAELAGVLTLRSWRDAERIAGAASEARQVVLVGSSFIGLEVAASLRERGVPSVTVVGRDREPLARVLGERVGAMLRALHEEHGVRFRLGTTVTAVQGRGRAESVTLEDGEELPADLVVAGIGVRPTSELVVGGARREDGGLVTDSYLRLADGVYAAGDIAAYPDWRSGERVRIEHWRLAEQQGEVAAHNMAGQPQPFERLPLFWTFQFGVSLLYLGHASSWDEIAYDGDVEAREFIAYYLKEGRVLAAAGMGRDRQLAALHELMLLRREPRAGDVRRGRLDLVEWLRRQG